jgi:hypothetical protein
LNPGAFAFLQSDEETVNSLRRVVRSMAARDEVAFNSKLALGKAMYALSQFPSSTPKIHVFAKFTLTEPGVDRPFCSLLITDSEFVLRSGVFFATGESTAQDALSVSRIKREVNSEVSVSTWFETAHCLLVAAKLSVTIEDRTQPRDGWTKQPLVTPN